MPRQALQADEARFRWLALAVLSATAAGLAWYGLRHGAAATAALLGATGVVFVSKLAIFGGVVGGHPFDTWSLALLAWWVDLLVALALLAGLSRLERLSIAGRALRRARQRAVWTLHKYPGLRRMALGGVVFFVFVPLPGSGAITGTILARLVGLPKMHTMGAVAGGAGLAVVIYASVAQFLGEQWQTIVRSPWTWAGSLLGVAAFAWIAWLRVQRVLREG